MNYFDDLAPIPIINEVEDYPDYIPASKLDLKALPSTTLVYFFLWLLLNIKLYKLSIHNPLDLIYINYSIYFSLYNEPSIMIIIYIYFKFIYIFLL